MNKYFNWLTALASLIGGGLSYVFGGFDTMLVILLCCMGFDYLTGVLKGVYEKKLSSEVGYKGIIKKVMIVVLVGVAYMVQRTINNSIPLREVVITFFVANEALSILENAAAIGLPIPEVLKKVLIQLREKADDESK